MADAITELKGALAKAEGGDINGAATDAKAALASVGTMKVSGTEYKASADYNKAIDKAAEESTNGEGYETDLPTLLNMFLSELDRTTNMSDVGGRRRRKGRKTRKGRKGTRKGRRGTRRMA